MAKTEKTSPDPKNRTSIYLSPDTTRKMRYMVFADNTTQTDIIREALDEYITKWEKKHGPVPPQKS